ncbi:MAG: BBP7 family outer membrane beta-barrel protein [Planctomycetota bacterium]
MRAPSLWWLVCVGAIPFATVEGSLMSLQNFTWRVIAVLTAIVASPAALGQVYHPLGDVLDVDPDWQWFAPVDVEEMLERSPRKAAAHGWFAAYDRTNLWVSRPSVELSAGRGDFGWGNRWDVGFMNDKDSGWLVSFRSMGGPNTYDRITVNRVDRINANDTGDPANPILPPEDRNDPQLGYRAYVLGDSLNVAGLTNFELNKTWRRSPYRYGGMLEPMVGFKYSTFNDTALNEDYFRSVNQISVPGGVLADLGVETLISDTTTIKNQMVGGQLGARYFNHSGRWTLSGEFRAFGMANFQSRRYERRVVTTEYTGIAGTVVMTDANTGTSFVQSSNNEFAFGFEARAEAAYSVTNFFQLRGGIDVINFAKGIWRGQNPGFGDGFVQDQDVQIAGFTFGVSINR